MSKIFEINCLTGEANERAMTAAEIELVTKINESALAVEAASEQRKTDRQAVLDRLGLTEQEAQLLLGGN